jgi:hypothetical protein
MKKIVIIFCSILLFWFFLDMTGLYFGDKYLVSQSFKDDWIFMLIYLFVFLLFIFNDKFGKYFLGSWLFMWLATQFYFHWYFTITGKGLNKIDYFKGSIKLINSETRYIPDLYHIVLHIFILVSLISVIFYIVKDAKKKKNNNF